MGILRTAEMLRWRISEVLEPEGITLAQFNVLRILRGAKETGLPTLEIGARLVEQAPGITRLIDRLELAGLVRCRAEMEQFELGAPIDDLRQVLHRPGMIDRQIDHDRLDPSLGEWNVERVASDDARVRLDAFIGSYSQLARV